MKIKPAEIFLASEILRFRNISSTAIRLKLAPKLLEPFMKHTLVETLVEIRNNLCNFLVGVSVKHGASL